MRHLVKSLFGLGRTVVIADLVLGLNAPLSMVVLIISNSGLPSTSHKVRYSSGGISSHPGDLPLFYTDQSLPQHLEVSSDSDSLSDREGRLRS